MRFGCMRPRSVDGLDMPFWKGGASTRDPGYDIELGSRELDRQSQRWDELVQAVLCLLADLNAWVHLAAVVDRTAGQLKVYKNGAFVTQTALGSLGSLSSIYSASVGASTAEASRIHSRARSTA